MEALRIGIAILIALVWAASFVADILFPEFDPPATVHLLMTMIVGALFGEQYLRARRNNNRER